MRASDADASCILNKLQRALLTLPPVQPASKSHITTSYCFLPLLLSVYRVNGYCVIRLVTRAESLSKHNSSRVCGFAARVRLTQY